VRRCRWARSLDRLEAVTAQVCPDAIVGDGSPEQPRYDGNYLRINK
jgi:hypothetical protein